MFKRLLSAWYFVRAGDYLSAGDYGRALHSMERVKELAGQAGNKVSLFDMNMRWAQAAKLHGDFEVALEQIGKARHKISITRSINEHERRYLLAFCTILEAETGLEGCRVTVDKDDIGILLKSTFVAKRFKRNYPIVF